MQYKKLEEERLNFENNELAKGCERLRSMVSQFNQEFKNDTN